MDLVAERPVGRAVSQPRPLRPDAWDHEQLEYDFSDWSEDLRAALTLHLVSANIPNEWVDDRVLIVPRARRVDVDGFVDLLEGELDPEFDAEGFAKVDEDRVTLASPGRRILAGLIDELVLAPIAFAIDAVVPVNQLNWWGVPVFTAYFIIAIAIWGRTLGNLAVGTRVERVDGSMPGWIWATVRWAVPAAWTLPALLGFGVNGFVPWAWFVAVYLPIFFGSRRGLHDRAAGTIVVKTRTVN